MARIHLRDYNREIERLIEGSHNDEAIAQCRYILQSYPKHIETYRLLGKALLEVKSYGDGADILQRVLSSVPDDFIGHLGMSIIREEQGDLNAALWHMERAFEVQPANNVIQEELRRLFNRRDGVEPARIQLTRGALARMYIKGDLHAQAIAELRAALAEDAERPDLQIMLARAYHRAGQRVEAAETASQLLIKFPYCLEANRILADILVGTERASEIEIYRQRVIALDPYYAHLPPGALSSDQAPDAAISLERQVYLPGEPFPAIQPAAREASPLAGAAGEEELPSWLTEVEAEAQSLQTSPTEIDAWESAATPQPGAASMEIPTESGPGAETETSIEPEPTLKPEDIPEDETRQEPEFQPEVQLAAPSEPVSPEEKIPDWLRNAGWEAAGPTGETPPDEGKAEVEGEGLASADIPEWLQALAPKDTEEAATPPREDDDLPWLEEEQAGELGEDEAWLAAQSGVPSTSGAEAALPDWLQPEDDGQSEQQPTAGEPEEEFVWPETPQMESPSSQEQRLPHWLHGLSEEPPGTPVDDINVWLPEESQPEAHATEGETPSQPAPDQLEPDQPQPVQEEVGAPSLDWFQAAVIEPVSEVTSAEEPAAQEPGFGEPDWLRAAGMETAESLAEAVETAGEVSSTEGPSADEPEWLRIAQEETSAATPDWLRSTEEVPAAENLGDGPAEEQDIPDWLKTALGAVEEPLSQTAPLDQAGLAGFPEEPPVIEGDTKPVRVRKAEIQPEQPPAEVETFAGPPETESASSPFYEIPSEEHQEAVQEPLEEPPASSFAEMGEALPDWLRSIGQDEELPAQAPVEAILEEPVLFEAAPGETVLEEQPAAPDLAAETAAKPATPDAEGTDLIPDWLRAMSRKFEPPAATTPPGDTDADIETPAAPEEPASEAGEELPEWLRSMADRFEEPTEALTPAEAFIEEPSFDATPGEAVAEEPPTVNGYTEEGTELQAHVEAEEIDTSPDWLRDSAGKLEAPSTTEAPSEIGLQPPDFIATPDEIVSEQPSAIESVSEEPAFDAAPGESVIEPSAAGTPSAESVFETLASEAAPGEIVIEPPAAGSPPAEAVYEEPALEAERSESIAIKPPEVPTFAKEAASAPIQPAALNLNTASLGELENIPGIGFILAQRIIAQRETAGAFSSLEDLAGIPGMSPEMVAQLSDYLAISPEEAQPDIGTVVPDTAPPPAEAPSGALETVPPQVEAPAGAPETIPSLAEAPLSAETETPSEPQTALAQAWNSLLSGDSDRALQQYGVLIQREQALEQVIHDLREGISRYPIDVSLYQALGDAYLRSGQLQEALDAYTKAEELLR
ncbi:MAG TPA: helix-hairpin-helix domain-containing protein [Anaerolineales bacterium]|nr:helix-hairpin-helix domain-containing protein [Anaerolineales bacterium]